MYRQNYPGQMNSKYTSKLLNINGSNYIFETEFTVLDLMDYLGFNKNVIVLDYNGTILEKTRWEQTYLQNKDYLEILSIAGGG